MGDYGEGGGGPPGGGEPPPASEPEELMSVEDFDAFLDNEDASVIGAFTAKEMVDPDAKMPEGWDEDEDGEWSAETIENPAYTQFKAVAGTYGYRFAYTFDAEVLSKLKSKTGGLYLYRSPKFLSVEHGDRPRERFPSTKFTPDAVTNWLEAKAQPLVGPYSMQTKDRYKTPVLTIFMNLDFDKNAKSVAYVLKRARKVAAGLKGKLAVSVGSLSEMSYEMESYGLTSTKSVDILMGIRSGYEYYGLSDKAFSKDSLTAFAKKFLAKELSPYVKPEEPPAAEEDTEEDAEGDEDKEEM